MPTQTKYEPNWEGNQSSLWSKRVYSEEGTEFDIRWGFVVADFGKAATLENMELAERPSVQVSGKKGREQEADSVESTAVHSTYRRAAINARS